MSSITSIKIVLAGVEGLLSSLIFGGYSHDNCKTIDINYLQSIKGSGSKLKLSISTQIYDFILLLLLYTRLKSSSITLP